MDKDAYYFPHFSNARHDRKIKRLIMNQGLIGYAVFFMILEVLRDQDKFKYPMTDIDLLADEFRVEEEVVRDVINNYELFNKDTDKHFYSSKFNEFMQPYLDRKERARNAANKRWKKKSKADSDANALLKQNESSASKVKKSKEDERRSNEIHIKAEKIYEFYPRKVGKEAAIKEIINAITNGVDCRLLWRKVKEFSDAVNGKNTKYIPYPERWFNEGRWEDDPKEWTAWKNGELTKSLLTYNEMMDYIDKNGNDVEFDAVPQGDGKKPLWRPIYE